MLLNVVAIKDLAADAFLRPFYVSHNALAVRSFMDEVNRADSEMRKHKGDYILYQLGSWSEDSGVFSNLDSPLVLCRAVDVGQPGE